MPTYSQLASEPAWNAEFAPPNLDRFYRWLRDHYNMTAQWIGGKGDNNHLRGYHRSRHWILTSIYASRGVNDYSIQHALDQGGDENWYSALDASLPAVVGAPNSPLYAACRRLDQAVRAGMFPQIREWYGTFDGITVVGWNAVTGQPASSDKSHLGHLHISFFRSLADSDHRLLYQVITGEVDMPIKDSVILAPGNPDIAKNKELQTELKARGHDLGTSGPNADGVDGGYGNMTTLAVKAEQAEAAVAFPDKGFTQTGSLDAKLADYLGLLLPDPAPGPGPDPGPDPGPEPVDYDRIQAGVRTEIVAAAQRAAGVVTG